MDLWIRSQNKEKLVIVCQLETNCVGKYSEEYWTIENYGETLGQYATKERALEVLDEIQKILTPTIIITNAKNEDGFEAAKKFKIDDYVTTENNANLKILKNTYVYQMPEE